jgi:hypothetical protein
VSANQGRPRANPPSVVRLTTAGRNLGSESLVGGQGRLGILSGLPWLVGIGKARGYWKVSSASC